MVFRVYVEKKKPFEREGKALRAEIAELLEIKGLKKVRVVNRYDAENIDKDLFDTAVKTVFSEPQTDTASPSLRTGAAKHVFAVEYLPGQFDQRADSAAQCIGLISRKERPAVRSAKVYLLYGNLTEEQVEAIKKYVINPVEAREAQLGEYETPCRRRWKRFRALPPSATGNSPLSWKNTLWRWTRRTRRSAAIISAKRGAIRRSRRSACSIPIGRITAAIPPF